MTQSGFQFSNPIVSKIQYIIHPDYARDKGHNLSITNAFETNISPISDDRKAIVELNITIGDMDSTKEPFFIALTIGASFKWDEAYSEDTIRDLLAINAPALLLSYARPIVSSITSMSPYRSYNIPFYNFTN